MKTIVNCTPHRVELRSSATNEITHEFATSGIIPRVAMNTKHDGLFGSVTYGEIENLPDPKENTMLIVSTIVFNAAKKQGRNDVCFPSGNMWRNEAGQIEACEFLAIEN